MDFSFSAEQQMLRDSARSFLAERLPLDRVASLADGEPGWDPASWAQLAGLGWLDADLDFVDQAVLLEEAGRGLYPGPLLSALALTPPLLAAAGGDLAPASSGGRRTTTVVRGRAAKADGDTLSGTVRHVLDGGIVDDALIVADDGAVWRVDLQEHAGVVHRTSTMDTTRRLAELRLDRVPATRLLSAAEAAEPLEVSRLRGLAGISCEAVGIAQRCLEISTAYVKERQQFGRPIGSFQGVSHRLADVYVAVETARSLAYWAAWCVSVGDVQAPVACAAAKTAASEAAVLAAERSIQAMGGIGFTWDHPLHRFYKRAQGIASYDGHPREHRATVAATLLDA